MLHKIRRFIDSCQNKGIYRTLGLVEEYIYNNFIKPIVRGIYVPPSIFIHSYLSRYLNIFNEEWDMVIILDTCRPDALAKVSSEYDFIQDIDTRWSVGSHSAEWMMNTFSKQFIDLISETAYVTSNPNSVTILEEEYDKNYVYSGDLPTQIARLFKYSISEPVSHKEFNGYIRVWDKTEEYGNRKYPSPRAVTNHAINIDRKRDPNRIIVHYMPPHFPYLAVSDGKDIKIADEPRPQSFDAYLDNLRWVLNEVEILLNNVDRNNVIITADHGESFSFRRWRSGHPLGAIYPSVRRVPYVTTDAMDSNSHHPDVADSSRDSNTEEILEALGYL